MNKKIILSFDVEEFDTPLEYGKELPLSQQMCVSEEGLRAVVALLDKYNVRATFFTTANFANQYPDLIRSMAQVHEIASHGYFHSTFEESDLRRSKDALEELIQKPILGYRMARMMPVSEEAIAQAGYRYNSSLHPTFLPGRYNCFSRPRTPFLSKGVVQIPASVTPLFRFPVFWLSFKNFPMQWIRLASRWIWNTDSCVNYYFHPWEFTDISDKAVFGLPFYVSRYGGLGMLTKLERHIQWARKYAEFITFAEWHDHLRKNTKLPGG
ncbi:polysaccharide deacetylase family protein [Cytophagaceae bacterium YF14B1]|uniref:Polysaccharide deacetylase family protein n=1 Tax=Xanthocytophaga flava TaxID=3048013 RepID=A0AAE3QPX7_9BACT|nr:polysaccharide deacetylase family protein [Xanthocytophaga flavus]MDJ1481060.1 polysaccharide deacetylase family protein [Xanthocytophaga flavus]